MYRKTSKAKKYAAMRQAKELIRLDSDPLDYPIELPDTHLKLGLRFN